MPDGDRLVDAYTAAAFLGAIGHPVQPDTIHQWAHRGLVTRGPKRGRHRLYDLAELRRVAVDGGGSRVQDAGHVDD